MGSNEPFARRHFLLDVVSINVISRSKEYFEKFLQFHWEYYSELEHQRARVYPALLNSLSSVATRGFEIKNWQRAVKLRYALDPLSPEGSLKTIGGRFNIGSIDLSSRFTTFPAIYLAENRDTAIQELLQARDEKGAPLNAAELSLTNTESIAVVAVNGNLDSVLDLRDVLVLDKFLHLIRKFSLSKNLKHRAKRLKIEGFDIIRTRELLFKTLLAENWRLYPMQYDIPATAQIFGRIVKDAGIEAILYPSVLTGDDCCAIFPTNFKNSDSYVEIKSAHLPPGASRNRLDRSFAC